MAIFKPGEALKGPNLSRYRTFLAVGKKPVVYLVHPSDIEYLPAHFRRISVESRTGKFYYADGDLSARYWLLPIWEVT